MSIAPDVKEKLIKEYAPKAGDTITYQTPRGELQVTLLAIEQP